MKNFVARVQSWDERIVSDLVPQRKKNLDRCMTLVTILANGWLWIAIALMTPFLHNNAEQILLQISLAIGLQVLIYFVLKRTISRKRPYEMLTNVPCMIPPLDKYSFPSGHTAFAFVILATVGVFYLPLFLPLMLLALLVGFSRVYVGVHYPSDVLAGAMLGITCATMAKWLLS